MGRPWREVRPSRQTICSRLRSRTLKMAFVLFWLPQTVYATALCLAMNSANDASVIYLPRVRKPRHSPCLGCATTWGRFRLGRVTPQVQFSKTLMENHGKWMELCALASKEQDPAKLLALTQEIARLLAEKRAAGERNPPPPERTRTGERQTLQSVRP